ncbi:GPI-anchored cell wall beta-1,3-endoglucanase EglC [Pyrenochaeta sp. DS3sAY3a]|nr:GPI-anchored cell wall beta-1,3-endoglucanase EglC [Pyrenochaeta sp. DS3sAY3a]
MRFSASLAVLAATIGSAIAQDTLYLGFNSGASTDTGKAKTQEDFEKEFKTAKALQGAPGNFSAIRLYSNIQWETKDTPIAAFPAAISTNTKLLLGIWASGTDNIDSELKALNAAVKEYGTKLTDLVIGISVGSEDLYRVSEPGIRNKAGVGNSAETIVKFIKTARERLASTTLKDKPITHVDTWTAWVNSSNKAVIDNIDFLSVNAFPFYESERDNRIINAGSLLSSALNATEAVAGGKDVWITETGWAYSGPAFGAASATVDNAETYWQEVGCALFGRKNVFWYTLRDANPDNEVKFAITDNLSTTPRFNLTCPAQKELPAPQDLTNTTSSGNSSNSDSNSNSNSNSNSQGSGNGTGAGSSTSVSLMNSMAMGLSVVFALAAWTL